MKAITRPAVAILLLLITLTATAIAQQKRQTPGKPQPKAAVATAPAPTFDTLVPADSYVVYGELRGVGQFVRSSALNDLLEPVVKLAGPPREFRTIVRWLNAHSEQIMNSRLLLATWSNNTKTLPETIIAIEFASAEEATKFTSTLNDFLPTVLPTPVPEPSAESSPRPDAGEKPKPPAPNFHLKRFGSLVVITPKAWTLKQLKPAGSKNLVEDVNFRAARNRFNSEPVFVYFDTSAIERQEEESQKRREEQILFVKKRVEAEAQSKKEEQPPLSEAPEPEPGETEKGREGVQAVLVG